MFGIRDPEKIHSGSRILGVKKHRIPDPRSGTLTLPLLFRYTYNLITKVYSSYLKSKIITSRIQIMSSNKFQQMRKIWIALLTHTKECKI
jgi:hypothetical protein